MEVDKLPSASRTSLKEMTKVIPTKRNYPLVRHGRTSSSQENPAKPEFSPTAARDDLALPTVTKEDKESRAVDYLLELSEGEDPNDKSFEERFKNVLLMPTRRETKRASNTPSNGFVQIAVPEVPTVGSDNEIKPLEKTQSHNSLDGADGLEPKFVPYNKSFREENNKDKPPLPIKKPEQQAEKTANKGNIVRLSRLDRHERRKRQSESRDLKQKQLEKAEKPEERVKTTESIVKPETGEFADEPELPKKVVKVQPLVVKGIKGLTAKETKEMTYDMILMESMKDFKKKMTKHFSKNKGKLLLLNDKRSLERKNSERSVETPRKSVQTLPLEDVVLMGRSVSQTKFETARYYSGVGYKSPIGQVKQTEELPSARSHFSRKERNKSTENSPKMLQETSVDKKKDEVLFEHEASVNKNNKSEQNSGFDLGDETKEELLVQPAEKNKVRVVSDLNLIRDHKLIKAVAMKRLGAEVHGRSVSLIRTYMEKEPKENKMKEDLEDLYNKLSGRAIVSNLANLPHNHYHHHHHQDGFVLPQRKLEFVSKLPKIHSLKLQESVTTRLLRMGSDRNRANNNSLTNRFGPAELLQPSTSEKEFNDMKLVGSHVPPGVIITKEGYMSSLQKGRKHAKSFNQKRSVYYKDGYPLFPLRDQQQTPDITENSNTKIAALYNWDEINHKNSFGLK